MTDLKARLDLYREDPGITIDWRELVNMVITSPTTEHANGFAKLVKLAQKTQGHKKLLDQVNEARKHSFIIEDNELVFEPIFRQMKKGDLNEVSDWYAAICCWYQSKLEHFIERKNHKRSFDTMVDAARAMCRVQGSLRDAYTKPWVPQDMSRPCAINDAYTRRMHQIAEDPTLADFIRMVWQAHREAGLIPKLLTDWENTCQHMTFLFGRNHRGTKPQVMESTCSLPMLWLWSAYADIGVIKPWFSPSDKAKRGGRHELVRKVWYPVRAPGNMLRALIHYHIQLERQKKLERFCAKHDLDMSTTE